MADTKKLPKPGVGKLWIKSPTGVIAPQPVFRSSFEHPQGWKSRGWKEVK